MRNHFLRAGRVANLPSGGGDSLPVTANLLFHFDAADSSSGDSTWTDKTSNNYVMTANGSPTYSSSDGGSWDFNGSSQYFENSSDIGTSSAPSAVTLIAFVKRDGSQSGWTGLVYGRQNSYINSGRSHGLHLYSFSADIGFSWNNVWDNDSNLTIPDDEWCMVAVTMESGDSDFYLYQNSGTTTVGNTNTLTGSYLDQGTWKWRLGRDANEDTRYWDGKIAIALAYTSKLTQTELTSIWDAYKSRYFPPPTLSSSTPADGATDFAANSDITLNFNKAVDADSGNIYIRETPTTSIVTSDLVLHLDANNYSGSGDWLDETSNDNDGTISGATYTNDGDADYFDFDGSNDYVELAEDSTLQLTGDCTFEFWVKPHNVSGGSQGLISRKASSFTTGGFVIVLDHSSASDKFGLFHRPDNSSSRLCETSTLSNDTWYHIVFSKIGSTITPYTNSVAGTAGTSTNTIQLYGTGSDNSTFIGKYWGGEFNGEIAVARVYKGTGLTASQVTQNYNALKSKYQTTGISVTGSQVSGSGTTTITINPSSDLTANTAYYINIDATAFDATSAGGGASYAGISDATTLNFTTAAAGYVSSDLKVLLDGSTSSSGDSTWADQSGNSNNGSIVGATYNSGNSGYWDLDGSNDYISLGTGSDFKQQVPITISVWLSMDNFSGNQCLYGTYQNTSTGNLYNLFRFDGSSLRFYGSKYGGARYEYFTASVGTISADTWYQFTAVIDGSMSSPTLKFYKNTTSSSHSFSQAFISTADLNDVDTRVGSNVYPDPLQGKIGVVMFYHKALSDSEVEQNFNHFKSRYGY